VIISIHPESGRDPAVRLDEPDDFKAFKIARSNGASALDVARALSQIGRAEGDSHVYVSVAALKRIAGERALRQEWLAQLDGMVAYARSQGWVDDLGAIRAHIE
jgi:hypothetical protein